MGLAPFLKHLSEKLLDKNTCMHVFIAIFLEALLVLIEGLISVIKFVRRYWSFIAVATLLVCVIGGVVWWQDYVLSIATDEKLKSLSDAANYGTSFGVLIALFTGVGLILLLITILVQQAEMNETRELMLFQQIENTVFKMFEVLNSIINEIHLENSDKREFDGRRAFKTFKHSLRQKLEEHFNRDKEFDAEDTFGEENQYSLEQICNLASEKLQEGLNDAWKDFWNSNGLWLGHYYRYLYRIVKFIDDSPLPEEHKNNLARVARAQLSDYELVLLFYNLKAPKGQKFRDLCFKYDFLKHAPKELLLCPNHFNEINETRKDYGFEN